MSESGKYFESESIIGYSTGPLESQVSIASSSDEPVDLLPEYCEYKDEGCSHAPSCLNCPLPRCVLDLPGGRQKRSLTRRNAEIVRLFTLEKKTFKEIAALFKISQRTVIRALATQSGRNQNE
jgi:hypothetical protein